MVAFIIIYLYVMGFLMTLMAVYDERGFIELPWWMRSALLAAWPFVLPASAARMGYEWLARRIRR